MPIKLVLSSKEILDHVFDPATPGYNALQVDEFLDRVIKDYITIESNMLIMSREYNDLKQRIEELEKQNRKLSVENEKYKGRLKNIKESDVVTSDNMDIIKRNRQLEEFIYKNGLVPPPDKN